MTFLSKLKKAPTPQHLEFKYVKYAPVGLTAKQLAASEKFVDYMTAETDRVIAEQQSRAMEYLAQAAPRPRAFMQPPGTPASERGIVPCTVCGERWGRHYGFACDPKCDPIARPATVDPLDAVIDGCSLRELLRADESNRREFALATSVGPVRVRASITPAQRAAISAHWSAELRAKVAAAKERDRNEVRVDLQDDEP